MDKLKKRKEAFPVAGRKTIIFDDELLKLWSELKINNIDVQYIARESLREAFQKAIVLL